MRDCDAARSVSPIIIEDSAMNSRTPIGGFMMMSTAPSSSARIAASLPRAAAAEQITTGSGSLRMICRRNVKPSMRGICRSSTTTSGRFFCIFRSAMSGSAAVSTEKCCVSSMENA